MKAIQYISYGNSDVLAMNEVDKPVPKEDEILIKIVATTVNPMEMKVRNGFMQNMIHVNFPFTPGLEVAGVVEQVGSKTTKFRIGDEVFATTFGGTYAEYISLKEDLIVNKPINVSFNEAAALAVPLVTAYTALVEQSQLKQGRRVIVLGAAGAAGAVIVQVAKALNLYVIGTASGTGVNMLKMLGADEVIDYKVQDFRTTANEIDLVIDLVGGDTQKNSFAVLKKGGLLLSTVAPPSQELAERFGVTARFIASLPAAKKLEFGKTLVESGKVTSRIAKIMQLKDASLAQDLVAAGGLNGKVVLAVSQAIINNKQGIKVGDL